ncbi:MAG TPA: hypothetical protein VM146_08365 [Steroidobacteraceae bacterium]|nr:hypothetical protein [Steroidobacteraceae bacterium]
MRKTLFLFSALVAATASASSFYEVSKAVNDDEKLIFAGIDPESVLSRKQCGAAILETDDAPNSFDCVYVQTEKDLNLLSLEGGYLMPEIQAKLNVIDGVALQRTSRWAQVQIFNGDKIAAFYIYGDNWIDTDETEKVYHWLIDHGVPQRNPRKWIGR